MTKDDAYKALRDVGFSAQEVKGLLRDGSEREQRRYEIARDVMAAIYSGRQVDNRLHDLIVRMSVEAADALLRALEEISDGE